MIRLKNLKLSQFIFSFQYQHSQKNSTNLGFISWHVLKIKIQSLSYSCEQSLIWATLGKLCLTALLWPSTSHIMQDFWPCWCIILILTLIFPSITSWTKMISSLFSYCHIIHHHGPADYVNRLSHQDVPILGRAPLIPIQPSSSHHNLRFVQK